MIDCTVQNRAVRGVIRIKCAGQNNINMEHATKVQLKQLRWRKLFSCLAASKGNRLRSAI
jgi:hypothetical protein